jgi:general stress protein YciG
MDAQTDIMDPAPPTQRPKRRQGFACMDPARRRAIASAGGRAAHSKGVAYEWTAEEARRAGSKGGKISRGGRGRNWVKANANTQ